MAITSLMVKGLAISPEAIQRNVDEWERRGRSWQGVDRFEMTEQQMISVVEKLYDTDYFSSTYLMSPSIPEFAVLIQEPDDYVNTYVCFRRTLLKEGDILTDDQDGLQKTVTPVIDAYVYANNKGSLCNIVISLGRCELRRDGHMMPCTAQVLSYTHRDPMTEYMLENPEDLRDFMRNVKSIYLAIQMLSLERPEVFVTKTEKVTHQEAIRKKGRYKKVNRTKLVKVTRVSDEELNAIEPHSIRTFTCPCWGVAGHWRTYKSGKKIWINPYRKGKQRSNPAAYTPKVYQLPEEEAAYV